MKKMFSRPLASLFCAAVLSGALTLGAAAADAPISVKLDDQPITFADAAPISRNYRTYVPFRAIFERMGASVSWDGDARTVTAVRNGRTVRFTIAQPDVSITQDGDTRAMSADAASFIEDGRTYVPVRFAAQAFGAAVGWVEQTQTVLIVDVEKLMSSYQGRFSTMDDVLAFSSQGGSRSLNGSFSLGLTYHTAMGEVPVNMQGAVQGAENAQAAQLSGTVKTDIAALKDAIAKNEGKEVIDAEVQDLLSRLANTSFSAIVSRVDGKLYLSSPVLTELGVKPDAYVALPLDQLAGSAMGDTLTAAVSHSFSGFVAALARQADLAASPSDTVGAVRGLLDTYAAAFGDDAFVSDGDTYTLSGGTGANSYGVTVAYDAVGTVTQVRTTGKVEGAGVSYQTAIAQTADQFTLELSLTSPSTADIKLSVEAGLTAGAGQPNIRPSGEIVSVDLP